MPIIALNPGMDWQALAAKAVNGDELTFAPGLYVGRLSISGKNNLTIRATVAAPVSVATRDSGTNRETPWATGPNVTIDAGNVGDALLLHSCNDVTIKGLRLKGGKRNGLRLVNCNRVTVTDVIGEANGNLGIAAAQEPEDQSKINLPGGHLFTRVVGQGNGASGVGMSAHRGCTLDDCASFFNNRGWFENNWGNGGRQIDGKWYAFVQNEGGGGKWALTDKINFNRFWTAANNGYGLWPDYKNSNWVVRHSQFGEQTWNQNNYDDAGFHSEINEGPILLDDCFFSNAGIACQVSESMFVTFKNCIFHRGGINHRAETTRQPFSLRDLLYDGCTRYESNYSWAWNGIRTEAERTAKNIRVIGDKTATGTPTWRLGWGDNLPPVPPDPTPVPPPFTPAPTDTWVTEPSKPVPFGGATWTITVQRQIARDAIIQTGTNNVGGLLVRAGRLFQNAHTTRWWEWSNSTWIEVAKLPDPAPTPVPPPPEPASFDIVQTIRTPVRKGVVGTGTMTQKVEPVA